MSNSSSRSSSRGGSRRTRPNDEDSEASLPDVNEAADPSENTSGVLHAEPTKKAAAKAPKSAPASTEFDEDNTSGVLGT